MRLIVRNDGRETRVRVGVNESASDLEFAFQVSVAVCCGVSSLILCVAITIRTRLVLNQI